MSQSARWISAVVERAPHSQEGFVLAITLWVLAGLAVIVAMINLWAREQVQAATLDREAGETEWAMLSTRETVLYMAATRELTRAGLPVAGLSPADRARLGLGDFGLIGVEPLGDEIRMDGRGYAGFQGVAFSLQDEGGLFSINGLDDRRTDAYLDELKVEKRAIPGLRDALRDYADPDDLLRLQGAEEAQYVRQARPPPPSRRLIAPPELRSVMGWDSLSAAGLKSILESASATYIGAPNLNVAPAELLPLYVAGCPQACDAVIRRREERPFANGYELEARAGVRLKGDLLADYRFGPSEFIRMTFWTGTGRAWRLHVRLTPSADGLAPWQSTAAYPMARPPDAPLARPADSLVFPDAQTRWAGEGIAPSRRDSRSDGVGRPSR